ncbi:MAG: hypothetical protein WB952_24725 [Terriglobales bacterium]
MEKTPRKSQRPSSEKVRSAAREPLDLAALREQITNLVCVEAVGMVETTIEQVRNGHYQALKYLFEMIGLYPAAGGGDVPEEDSLAATLLRHLGISAEEMGSLRN